LSRPSPLSLIVPEWMWTSLAGSNPEPPAKAKTNSPGFEAEGSSLNCGRFPAAQ